MGEGLYFIMNFNRIIYITPVGSVGRPEQIERYISHLPEGDGADAP